MTHSLLSQMSSALAKEAITDEARRNEPEPLPVRDSKKRTRDPVFRFRGVRQRSWGRYVSEIRIPGKKTRIWLGSFVSPEMAARAHDSAAFFLKGKSATLNFPDSVDSLPRPRSFSPRDIQMAAAKAALNSETKGGQLKSDVSCSNGLMTDKSTDSDSENAWWILDSELVNLFEEEVKETSLLSPLRLQDCFPCEIVDDGFLFF